MSMHLYQVNWSSDSSHWGWSQTIFSVVFLLPIAIKRAAFTSCGDKLPYTAIIFHNHFSFSDVFIFPLSEHANKHGSHSFSEDFILIFLVWKLFSWIDKCFDQFEIQISQFFRIYDNLLFLLTKRQRRDLQLTQNSLESLTAVVGLTTKKWC